MENLEKKKKLQQWDFRKSSVLSATADISLPVPDTSVRVILYILN